MLRQSPFLIRLCFVAGLLLASVASCPAQKHSLGSAPPTAPVAAPHPAAQPPAASTTAQHSTTGQPAAPIVRQPAPAVAHTVTPPAAPAGPIAAISTGLGAIQFATASFDVPAPQTLTRQLSSDDERTRNGALTSLGAPGQYLDRGHAPNPHSMQLDMVQLSSGGELDAVLTVELDQHVVSAILVPEGATWRRVATLTFASSFNAGATTPANFVRPLRSWLEPGRYRATYHATVNGSNGDFTENEADLRVINGRADVVISFVSGARQCDATGQLRPPHQTCEILQRWFEPDPTDATHRFLLVTGTGHLSAHEASDPVAVSRNYRLTRLRSFTCQPFVYSESAQHFEPTANSAPCGARDATTQHAIADHAPPPEQP